MSSLSSRYFTTKNGNKYEVIATEYGTSKEVLDAIDTVRNEEGIIKKMSRSKLLKLIKS